MMSKKGFTLVELMAVIIILGILATLAGTAVMSIMSKSQDELLQEQIKGLGNAAVTYVIAEKVYLESCPSTFNPASPTNSDCYERVTVRELVSSKTFENNNNLCDENKTIIVYRDSIGELLSYVPENTCSY